jgi:DNA-binding NarL/FixJ family response regulator
LHIVVVGDRDLVRSGIVAALDPIAGLSLAGDAKGADAVSIATARDASVVVLDLGSSEGGLELTDEIRRRLPDVAVVAVTDGDDDELILGALRLGVRAVVATDVPTAELAEIVGRAADGQTVVSAGLANRLIVRLAAHTATTGPEPDPLTARELEILGLMADGRTNREIAGRLIVAVGTVKVHIEHILAKLGAADRTEAAVRGMELGLVHREGMVSPQARRP